MNGWGSFLIETGDSNRPWHLCMYEEGELITMGPWVDGKWYEWATKDHKIVKARMKADAIDHFYPSPEPYICEEDVVAYRELEK